MVDSVLPYLMLCRGKNCNEVSVYDVLNSDCQKLSATRKLEIGVSETQIQTYESYLWSGITLQAYATTLKSVFAIQ